MKPTQRTITTLLAAIALLLALNLAVSLNLQAEAQPQVAIAPHVVAVTTEAVAWNTDVNQQVHLSVNQLLITRTWSDGLVEYARVTDPSGKINFTSWTEVPE